MTYLSRTGKRSGTPRQQGGSAGVNLLISHHIFQILAQSMGRYGWICSEFRPTEQGVPERLRSEC